MPLRQQIQDDVKTAMKAREAERLATLRLITAAIKQFEVDNREEASDETVLTLLSKMVKQRRESFDQFTKAGRQELADQETYEIGIIETYLPEQMDESAIDQLIDEAVQSTGAAEMKDMGKVMGLLKPKLQGRADMGLVSQKIRAKLA